MLLRSNVDTKCIYQQVDKCRIVGTITKRWAIITIGVRKILNEAVCSCRMERCSDKLAEA